MFENIPINNRKRLDVNIMSQIANIDSTLYAFSEIFPAREPETKFDKFLELVKAFSSGTLIGYRRKQAFVENEQNFEKE